MRCSSQHAAPRRSESLLPSLTLCPPGPSVHVPRLTTQVCEDYRLSAQTSWTAMHYFDRYLGWRGATPIERNEAELISLTCILLAAKFLERHSPVRLIRPSRPRPRHRLEPPPTPPVRLGTSPVS